MKELEGANNRNTELQSAIGKLEEDKVSLYTQVLIYLIDETIEHTNISF